MASRVFKLIEARDLIPNVFRYTAIISNWLGLVASPCLNPSLSTSISSDERVRPDKFMMVSFGFSAIASAVCLINQSDYDFLRPKAAHFGRAHGLPKVHKHYNDLPPFRPIIDTTGTQHYNVGKFLPKLLNPLAQNGYTLRDSFHAVSEIKSTPKELFSEGYRLVSFDVVSLFTNVPLTKTVKIILDRVLEEKLVTTTFLNGL